MKTCNKLASCEKKNRVSKRNSKLKRKRRNKCRVKALTSPVDLNKQQLLLNNEKESCAIAKLEKSLKLTNKSALHSKSFCDDGLDYLLETCDRVLIKPKCRRGTDATSNSLTLESEIKQKAGKSKHDPSREKIVGGSSRLTSSAWMVKDFDKDNIYETDDILKSKTVQKTENVQEKTYLQEPELDNSSTEKRLYLKKQVKGLLNRLTEANMHKIVLELEALYLSNSRNSINKILEETIMISVGSSTLIPERLIQEYAMLIAILHANVDMSVGVIVVHSATKEFHTLYQESCDECKKLDNIILLVAHLYNFKVIDDILVYDVLNLLTERFSEKDIELILLLLRTVGISLRKSNSAQLKELILKLQKKASEAQQFDIGCRVKYMLDVVLAIKNNNIQKIPNYDPDHIEHLKKIMRGFIHPGKSVTQIKIGLEDMIKAKEHGHLLKSLTSGHISVVKSQSFPEKSESWQSESLSKLVKKHRMNTDVRRQIFSILITAEDYLDAFEKILQMHSKGQQDDEVMNLIVHCALQGKTYNPFYQFLACKLGTFNRKYLLYLQYSVLNKLEELNNLKREQASNLAKFVSNCIIEKSLPLTSLKVLDFSMMNQRMTIFLKDVMLNILMNSSHETFEFMCKRSTPPKYAVFRESLWLYVKHILCSPEALESSGDINHLRQRLDIMQNIFGL